MGGPENTGHVWRERVSGLSGGGARRGARSHVSRVLVAVGPLRVLTLCPEKLVFLNSCPLMVVLSCSDPVLGCPGLFPKWEFPLSPASCNTSPPGTVLHVRWLCRRGNEMTVFNCSSSSFSQVRVQSSALYLKSDGQMQYSGGLEETASHIPSRFRLNEAVRRER